MKRSQRRLLNIFAFSLLAFAIYLNFFYKEDADFQKIQSVAKTGKVAPASH
jgi:hypothetical protein